MNLAAALTLDRARSAERMATLPSPIGMCQISVYRVARFSIVLASRRCLVFCFRFLHQSWIVVAYYFHSVTKSVFQKCLISKIGFELRFAC